MLKFFTSGAFLKSITFWLIVGAIIFLIIWQRSCNQKNDLQIIPNTEYKKPEKVYQDEKGNQHQQQTSLEASTKVIDKLVDSLLSENKNLNKALLLVQQTTHIDTIFQEKIIYKDSLGEEFEIVKKDKDIDLTVTGNLRTNESKISLKIHDTLSMVMSQKKRFLRSDQTLVDISHSNSYLKGDQMRSFVVPQQKVVIAIGPTGGVGWTGTKIVSFVGIGATLNIIPIKTRK